MYKIPAPFLRHSSRLYRYILYSCIGVFGVYSTVFASTKDEIRFEANQVMVRFEKGEISEASALDQLELIEKKAELLQTPRQTSVLQPTHEIPKVESVIGTSLVRAAAFPQLSPWEWFWNLLRPFLLVCITIFVVLWYTIGFIGMQKLEIWSRKLSQIYRYKRDLYFPASVTRHPGSTVTPLSQGSHATRTRPRLRHSGEVPDSLT
jgi:hypothetical protein